jgi:CheY-like chemotaxis protein
MIVKALERLLTGRGHSVRSAFDAPGALVLLQSERFDAALVDARMPGGGLTVVERLQSDPDFVGLVVLMTGALVTDPHVQVGPEVVRLQKPFRLKDLVPLVEGSVRH